ncbi:hypothetical protein HYDPIDRAFT_112167, partial [Hydnomerulius pinastri MD-312]
MFCRSREVYFLANAQRQGDDLWWDLLRCALPERRGEGSPLSILVNNYGLLAAAASLLILGCAIEDQYF